MFSCLFFLPCCPRPGAGVAAGPGTGTGRAGGVP